MSSCDKNDGAPRSYVNMSINGQEWTSNPENNDISATVRMVNNQHSVNINAKKNLFNGQPSDIIINFKRNEAITEQAYEFTNYNNGLYDGIIYKQNGKTYTMSAGNGAGVASIGSCTLTITKIKDYPSSSNVKYISGTFTAEVVRNGVTLNITDGKFHDYRSE